MESFELYNPTKIIFGKDAIDQLPEFIRWKKALVMIGEGSVKRNGLYARIISLLNMSGLEHLTFEGIKSNPHYQKADEACRRALDFGAEVIIAVGGGSVIDAAKAVSIGYYADHSIWDFYSGKKQPAKALPLVCVLTMAACGTENNNFSILQNPKEGIKAGFSSDLLFPLISILDPAVTLSVPRDCTAYGISNLIAHCLEQYFGRGDSPLSDEYAASVIRLAVTYGQKVLHQPEDYDARANLMWLATNALNGNLSAGKSSGDWGCHRMEQSLSVLFNTPHGAGLSVIYPAWLKHHLEQISDKLNFLAARVFDIPCGPQRENALKFISRLERFFMETGTPIRLQQLDIGQEEKEKIINNLKMNRVSGKVYRLKEADYSAMLDKMWESF